MHIMQVITDYIRRSLLTTQGDLIVRGASLPERLAAVAVGQVFKSAGVGATPAWGVPSLEYLPKDTGRYSQAIAGDEVVSGLGFTPALLFLFGRDIDGGSLNWCVGFNTLSESLCLAKYENDTLLTINNLYGVYIRRDVDNYMGGNVSAFSGDGFTITHTLVGACNIEVGWIALG